MPFKKLDSLIIREFIPPLVIWTLVAMFIFNMQFLWKYIDDIVGKGLDLTVVFEMIFYQALAMMPKALVFGVMIASVMSLGNLAESYELAIMKSSGMSLARVMMPLIFFCTMLGGISYFFADQIIPIAALKFRSRLYDIRKQKPTLVLKKGMFNNDFKNVVIYIGDKGDKGNDLEQVRIYDHTKGQGYNGQTNAAYGELMNMKDTLEQKIQIKKKNPETGQEEEREIDTTIYKSYLVVRLKNGVRYEEMKPTAKRPSAYPNMEIRFDEYVSMYDMSEFEFSETDESLFRHHHAIKSTKELLYGVDSLKERRAKRIGHMQRSNDNLFHFRRTGKVEGDTLNPDRPLKQFSPRATVALPNKAILDDFLTSNSRAAMWQRAEGSAQNIKGNCNGLKTFLKSNKESHINYENEIHQKLSFAFALLLFLFIGAPMGSIIKKGGFGVPVLVAFTFFTIFFVLHMTGERVAKNGGMDCWMGAWLPNLVLFPISILLTYMAMTNKQFPRISFSRKKKKEEKA